MIGRTISHYRIVSQLAAGGMGVVYRAEDVRLGREVAVKCVLDDFMNDEQAIARLRAEARAASALNHSNICTIYDIGEADGHPFIVMELLKGESLREKLVNGPLKVHKLVDYGIEIADALAAAHTDGIIHRDIKPGNIFITERGHVKVLDFGLAKLTARREEDRSTDETYQMTEVGVTLGTIAYMSPEQATGEDLDPRTDLFSLGVVLYECATGQHPFPGSTSAATLSGILTKAPVAPITLNREIPLRLQEVINNCLEKDRELRYQSAADLGADLKRVRRDMDSGRSTVMRVNAVRPVADHGSADAVRPISDPKLAVPPPAAASGSNATPASSWRGAALGAVGLVALLGAGAWYLSSQRGPDPPAPSAAAEPPVSSPGPAPDPGTSISAAIQSRAQLASASLKGGNYRAALSSATEVLALDPGHVEARRIRDEAAAMLERFDRALADARARINARDISGASRALETARAIDPTAPGITAVGALLSAAAARSNTTLPPAATTTGRGDSETSRAAADSAPAPPPVQQSPPPAAPPAVPVVGPPASSGAPTSTALPTPPASAPAVPEATPAKKVPEGPTQEQDEQAIRQLVASFGRAIEAKDFDLYRSIRPNLSLEEARAVQDGFRAVTSQRVELTVTSIVRQGANEATVNVGRRDVIQAGGRQQTSQSQQTIRVARQGNRWIIVNIR